MAAKPRGRPANERGAANPEAIWSPGGKRISFVYKGRIMVVDAQ
ncbi:MAG TPA: hypothetical protein VKT77_14760 [Chthonomonadaceae bacterium]|nr:hypothetical protein [Chthonomonadaceae bacterium]